MSRAQRLGVHLALLVLCLPALLPFLWMVSSSLKSDAEIYATPSAASPFAALIPHALHPANYPEALRDGPVRGVPRQLARPRPHHRRRRRTVQRDRGVRLRPVEILGTRPAVRGDGRHPGPAGAGHADPSVHDLPLAGLVRHLPSARRSIVPRLAFLVFLLVQFFRTLPEETAESARLDGASDWTIFTRIVLPLSKPALATCALFQFLGSWNDFMGPLIYINDPDRYTLAYGLQQFYSSYGGKWAQLMAGATLFTLPIIVLFFFAQKTFIQGIATTGGKS